MLLSNNERLVLGAIARSDGVCQRRHVANIIRKLFYFQITERKIRTACEGLKKAKYIKVEDMEFASDNFEYEEGKVNKSTFRSCLIITNRGVKALNYDTEFWFRVWNIKEPKERNVEQDSVDVVKMLLGIINDRYTQIPTTCTSCRDASGQIIAPSKAVYYAQELIAKHDTRTESGVPSQSSGLYDDLE